MGINCNTGDDRLLMDITNQKIICRFIKVAPFVIQMSLEK